jgi:hypothetical protein
MAKAARQAPHWPKWNWSFVANAVRQRGTIGGREANPSLAQRL